MCVCIYTPNATLSPFFFFFCCRNLSLGALPYQCSQSCHPKQRHEYIILFYRLNGLTGHVMTHTLEELLDGEEELAPDDASDIRVSDFSLE